MMTDDHRRLIPADPSPNLSFDKNPHWSRSIAFVFQTDLAPVTPPPWRRSHPVTPTTRHNGPVNIYKQISS